MGLLRQFEGMQLPAASELEWLVPEHDAPQKVCLPAHAVPCAHYNIAAAATKVITLFVGPFLSCCPFRILFPSLLMTESMQTSIS